MILIDFSAIFHQTVFSSIKACNPKIENGKYLTEQFMPYCFYRVFEIIFDIQKKFSTTYKDIVICLDKTNKKNWRKEIYSAYKGNRKSARDESKINFYEVFGYLDKLINELKTNSPFKIVEVESAEADDVILCLAKHFSKFEKILIISSDKDLIQAQKFGNVDQFSMLTQKFVTYETKHANSLNDWIIEHIVLGDACDNVPKIVDDLKFSENFKNYLKEKNINLTPFEFEKHRELYNIDDYKIFKLNKKNEPTELDIFEKPRFGVTSIYKKINEFGSLENWINSDEHLKYNFERNEKLVLEENIPAEIFNSCISNYMLAPVEYDYKKFKVFLKENKITNLETILPVNFINKNLSADEFFDF